MKKLNEYFICDEGEQPSLSDMLMFYGISGLGILISIYFIWKVVTL